MRRELSILRQVLVQLFREKWENLLGLYGLIAALTATTFLPVVVPLVFIVALLLDAIFFVLNTGRELREKQLPLLVIAGRSDDEYMSMVDSVWRAMRRRRFEMSRYARAFDIDRADLTVRLERDLPPTGKQWRELAQNGEEKVIWLDRHLHNQKIYHVFLNCPAALAVGLGALLGTRYPVRLYHYVRADDAYFPVIDLSRRETNGAQAVKKEPPGIPTLIAASEPATWTPDLYVSLNLAFHSPHGDVQRLAETTGAAVATLDNSYGNVLPLDRSWLPAAQEVATQLMTWISRREVQRLHLFLSCPLPLAFAIGMALGTQSPVTVYHWFQERQEYRPVLQLDQLRQPR